MPGHVARMAGAVDEAATGSTVGGFVDTVTELLAGLVGALESIANGGCTLRDEAHRGSDCLVEFPGHAGAWCPSCVALAALAGAKLRASDG